MNELTREQVEEQLENIHFGSVDVRVKSMACILRHDAALRATIQQRAERLRVTAQMLIAEIGSVGPEDAEEAAGRAVAKLQQQAEQIERLTAERDEAIKKQDDLTQIIIANKIQVQSVQRNIELQRLLAERDATIAEAEQREQRLREALNPPPSPQGGDAPNRER